MPGVSVGRAVAVPVALAFLGDAEHFVDIYFASHDMKVLRYNERGMVAEGSLLELPDGPTGVVLTLDGKTAFVKCRWARSVAQVSLADIRTPKIVREVQVTAEPWDAQRIHGARVFHNTRDTRDARMTPNRWLSCGICHLDGGLLSDGLVWEFTEAQEPDSVRKPNTKSLALASWSLPPLFISGKVPLSRGDGSVRPHLSVRHRVHCPPGWRISGRPQRQVTGHGRGLRAFDATKAQSTRSPRATAAGDPRIRYARPKALHQPTHRMWKLSRRAVSDPFRPGREDHPPRCRDRVPGRHAEPVQPLGDRPLSARCPGQHTARGSHHAQPRRLARKDQRPERQELTDLIHYMLAPVVEEDE